MPIPADVAIDNQGSRLIRRVVIIESRDVAGRGRGGTRIIVIPWPPLHRAPGSAAQRKIAFPLIGIKGGD